MSAMTFEVRQLIREHRDDRARRLLADEEDGKVCSGCGADYASSAQGCRACTDRHRNRVRRVNPLRVVKNQCSGVTYYGSRCANTALDGDFCYAHRQATA